MSCQKSEKIKPDKFRGVGVKSCVLFICFVLIAGKKWRKYKKMQEIASNLSRNKLSFE